MTKRNMHLPLLGGVMALQVALAALLFWQGNNQAAVTVEPLLTLTNTSITRLELAGDDERVTLLKQGDRWQVGNGLPVESQRVADVLTKLGELKTGWPLATSKSAQQRFEVADDTFNRKVSVYAGDEAVAEVYLGSTVSFKQVHVRAAGDDNIYAGALSTYELPTNVNAWLDTALLQPKGEVQALASGEFTVAKADGAWPGAAGAEAAAVNDAAEAPGADAAPEPLEVAAFDPAEFASTLASLRVLGVAEDIAALDAPEVAAGVAADGSDSLQTIAFEVTTADGTHRYELLHKNSQYYVRRNDYNVTFKIAKTQYDQLAAIAAAQV